MKNLLRLVSLILLMGGLLSFSSPSITHAAAPAYNWLQFNGDPQHSGANTREKTILPGNVSALKLWFQVTLPGNADGAPVYLSAVSTPGGVRDLIFVTTINGWIVALDGRTGATVWSHQNGPGSCHINNGANVCYTTSSPAIDPNLAYVYSYGLDGSVHKYQVGNGSEVTSGGWPEPVTLKPYNEKGSSALSIATASGGASYLYVASAGYPGDAGDYQGHITAINLADGSQKVFNANCSDQAVHFVETPGTPDCPAVQSAIWARPGVVYSAANNRIYMATGNGDFLPAGHDWGDTVFALNPDGTGSNGNPLDTYTPADFQTLQNTDADLGSTDVAILPVPLSSSVQHLAVQGGKDQLLRLLNLDNLSGQGGPGHTGGEIGAPISVPQGGMVLTQPAVWINPADGSTWVFVANGSPLDTYTPADFQTLQNTDADLGSTDVAILPAPPTSSVQHLAVQGGKDQLLRLLNLDNLSGQGGTGHTGGEIGAPIPVPQGGMVLTQPAVWTNPADGSTWVFVANSSGLSALKLVVSGGVPSLSLEWKNASGGTSPVVAAGVLYYARGGLVQAVNPLTGAILWSNNQIANIHWESPIVDNGALYITDELSHLTAYSLFGINPAALAYTYLPAIRH